MFLVDLKKASDTRAWLGLINKKVLTSTVTSQNS